MNAEGIRDYVLAKEAVTEGFPFGETALVFKTGDKMFLLVALDSNPLQFNAKCNPDKAVELREAYPDNILPGYHMNKKHWNTVVIDGHLPRRLLLQLIDDSYDLVHKKPKR